MLQAIGQHVTRNKDNSITVQARVMEHGAAQELITATGRTLAECKEKLERELVRIEREKRDAVLQAAVVGQVLAATSNTEGDGGS